MKKVDYIIRKGRFPILFFDVYLLFIILFCFISIFFVVILKVESDLIRFLSLISSFFIFSFFFLFYSKLILKRISFETFINKSARDAESIVAEISLENSLKLYKQDVNVFKMSYTANTLISYFRYKREITIVVIDNAILINFRNFDKTIMYNLKDKMELKIKEALELKTENKLELFEYNIFEPYNHLSKN